MTSQEFSKEISHIAQPLLEAGIYPSVEAFFKDVVKDMAARRATEYEGEVRKYRAKYGSLGKLGAKIKGKASPRQEDIWMEWEAAEDMLKAWKKVAES